MAGTAMARRGSLPREDVERERAVEERTADHRAFAAERLERVQVVLGTDAPGGYHRQARGFEHPAEQREIRAGERSVPFDRSAVQPDDTGVAAGPRALLGCELCRRLPSGHRDPTGADVQGDDEPVAEGGRESFE